MKQFTLAMAAGFERYGRSTRRAEFLSAMEIVVPWADLVALIEAPIVSHLESMLALFELVVWEVP